MQKDLSAILDYFNLLKNVPEIKIKNLPLYFSEYYVDVYLGDEKEDFQVIENAFSFKVSKNDIYNSGIIPEQKFNKIILQEIQFS